MFNSVTKVIAGSKYRLKRRRGGLYSYEGQCFINCKVVCLLVCLCFFLEFSVTHYLPQSFVIWQENPPWISEAALICLITFCSYLDDEILVV